MISGQRRQNCAILPTSLILNLRKLHAKRCAIEPSSRFFSEAPSETWKNKNTYCKTHDKIFGTRWRMKLLPVSFKNQRKVLFFYRQGRNVWLDLVACLKKTIWNHACYDLHENSQSQRSRRSTRAFKVNEYRYWWCTELMDRIVNRIDVWRIPGKAFGKK